MPRTWKLAAVAALACTLAHAQPAQADDTRNKVALLIGVGAYPEGSGYDPLNVHNDLAILQGALQPHGFDEVTTLVDGDATREGIAAAIRAHLRDAVQPGDVAVFHFSGHGTRITDDGQDEPDGYDEALVPVDATREGAGMAAHLRDDDLGSLLDEVRAALGPDGHLLVTLDTCSSGTATRAAGLPSRGSIEPLGPARSGASDDSGTGSGLDEGLPVTTAGTAPMTVLAAARWDQKAREIYEYVDGEDVPVGAFSAALAEVLLDAGPELSYREVVHALRAGVVRRGAFQTPQLEGAIDRVFLDGTAIHQPPYHLVGAPRQDGTVSLDAGVLAGIHPGTRVELWPAGASKKGQGEPLGVGEVVASRMLDASFRLDAGEPESVTGAWAYVTEHAYGDQAITVTLDEALPTALAVAVAEGLAASRTTRLVDEGASLEVSLDPDSGQLRFTDGVEGILLGMAPLPSGTEGAVDLVALIRLHARSLYVRRLDMQAEDLAVEVEVLPARLVEPRRGQLPCQVLDDAAPAGGESDHGLAPGVVWMLRVTSKAPRRAWISVLDILPDGSVSVIYPTRSYRQTDNFVQPGQHRDLACFKVEDTPGMETIKVFATARPTDLSSLETRVRGVVTRAATSPLEELLWDAWADEPPTRDGPPTLPAGTVSTATVTFEVLEEE